jgi:hypothetical protein
LSPTVVFVSVSVPQLSTPAPPANANPDGSEADGAVLLPVMTLFAIVTVAPPLKSALGGISIPPPAAKTLPVQVLRAVHDRYPVQVEAAAYFTVAEALDNAARRGADHAAVSISQDGGRLMVTVEDDGPGDASPMVAVADRVGALGGSLSTGRAGSRAEIPCG